jgi:hypothetical protein
VESHASILVRVRVLNVPPALISSRAPADKSRYLTGKNSVSDHFAAPCSNTAAAVLVDVVSASSGRNNVVGDGVSGQGGGYGECVRLNYTTEELADTASVYGYGYTTIRWRKCRIQRVCTGPLRDVRSGVYRDSIQVYNEKEEVEGAASVYVCTMRGRRYRMRRVCTGTLVGEAQL